MKDRGVRDRVIIITKGGLSMGEGKEGLGKAWLPQACEESLRRLQTDYIDLYLSHRADPGTPIEETLEIFQQLIDAGKIRSAGCSNYTADELQAALDAAGDGRARYEVVQPHYNLAARGEYEGALEDMCASNGLGVITYFSLAAGFLTGKYRKQEDLAGRTRGNLASMYMNPRGLQILDALDAVAARHEATPAQVALAWLMARPSVTAPIASATNLEQLADIFRSAELQLSPEDLAELNL
jgi:aryl-alcohol dehydrogenase-like predicted oxidoreductase